ncbi:DUF6916 family protein [Arenicella xantha]|uniref:DUF6916 domain-containing protein n=1 Tax=Arenicella xantha TaxID=644221 RepID=A0A395JJ03_9GAMM|nr:hypothetical protein [Arenicella xantha]RBP48758.1 hypothetical protein DFR28_10597 [Arenicella xantha]
MNSTLNRRRSFLQCVTLGGVAIASPLTSTAALNSLADGLQRTEFPLPDFDNLIGEVVQISCVDSGVCHATVSEVANIEFESDTVQRPKYLRQTAKVVRFDVDGTMEFSNTLYHVSHPMLGKLELLLSPVPDADGAIGLEAVFN